MTKFLYKYSPCFIKAKLGSSALLNTSSCPNSTKRKLNLIIKDVFNKQFLRQGCFVLALLLGGCKKYPNGNKVSSIVLTAKNQLIIKLEILLICCV